MKSFLENEIVFKLGQNAEENWEIIDTDESFIWFHLNSFPSGHVVIESSLLSDDLILKAAQLCKQNTKYRNLKNVKVCYTNIGNLKKGKEVGSVVFKSKRKVNIIML
tara:strand:+ start:51 stop:371 length:321 start_codon:yes stop_codon:yes gene_type:complete